MKHNIIRMPESDAALQTTLERVGDFIDSMYSTRDIEIHGPMKFQLGHWLYLWDSGAGFLLERVDDSGQLLAVAMVTKYRDMWSCKMRVELARLAVLGESGLTDEILVGDMKEYLLGVRTLLEFDELYMNRQLEDGSELRELLWHSQSKT